MQDYNILSKGEKRRKKARKGISDKEWFSQRKAW